MLTPYTHYLGIVWKMRGYLGRDPAEEAQSLVKDFDDALANLAVVEPEDLAKVTGRLKLSSRGSPVGRPLRGS